MIPEPQMPTYEDLLWPTLKALESIGGSASIQELCQGRRETRPKGGAKHCHRDRGGEVVRGGRDSA